MGPVAAQDPAIYKHLVESVIDYAIFALDATGHIRTWNPGAERLKGFTAGDVVGKHFSMLYPPADRGSGKPENELRVAAETGRYEEEGWRVKKDGSLFWANVVVTPIRAQDGTLTGFSKGTRDLTRRRKR
jgi:PAS domain S-box-containing protein